MGNGSSKRRVASVTAPPKQLLEEQSKLGWKELLFPSVLDKTRLQPYSVSTEELNFMWDQFLVWNTSIYPELTVTHRKVMIFPGKWFLIC